jgi:putative CocE/NonD family hydrolase
VGTPKAILYVSSNSLDTDFCVKISDVHPNGKIYNISAGFLRMRFRESLAEVKLMKPGVIYRIEIDLHPVANAFLKGHAIQFQITSSDFPVHVRNLNTGLSCEFTDEILETEQTIYYGGPYDSQIILPTIVKGCR